MYVMSGKCKTFVLSNLTYKYITMEDLLTPQICMDVEETPLDVGKDTSDDDSSSETGEPEVDDDEKVKMLLEEKFIDNAQVPEELTDFEKEAKKNVFAIGEPAVQFQRLHCTACNVHLGSAPIGHFNRYIHPLLKVLLCKACYEFYCSGEFDKDEDGSEMYCRWCGQGGKVMCCAQCAYVFCQKCVRQNLGKRTLELIKDSDDWLCFGCNPTQLINLKIICTSLCEFVQEEIRLSKSLNNIERLKVDHTVCCQKVKAAKRKRDEDATYSPHRNEWEEQKTKKPSILKTTLSKSFTVEDDAKAKSNWNQKEEAEVVCTPDLLSLMEDDPPPLTPMPKSAQMSRAGPVNPILSNELNKAPLNVKQHTNLQPKPVGPEGKKWFTIAPKPNMMMICNTNNIQRSAPNFVRLQTPAIKFVPSVNRTPVVNSVPAQITPGTKHEWYDKAATVVSTITGTLSATLMNLTKEQRNAKSVEQLANIHNKLQELLSSSVNSLIQVRKNLRTEFLADLNKLKFSNAHTYANKNNNCTITKPKPHNSSNKENDDDDVIIINSEPPANKPFSEPPPLAKLSSAEAKSNGRPYLKVRSVSQLLSVSSECITIPDDPPSDDVIAVEEKDPLDIELPAAIPEQSTSDSNEKTKEAEVPLITKPVEDDGAYAINIKNAITESKIEQFVIENMKLVVNDIPPDELRRILSVRVLLATNFQEDLPANRLKTTISFDTIDNLTINENANVECESELTNTDAEPGDINLQLTESTDVVEPTLNNVESPVDENSEKIEDESQNNVTEENKNEECKNDENINDGSDENINDASKNDENVNDANKTDENTNESTKTDSTSPTNEGSKDCDEEMNKHSENNDASSENNELSSEGDTPIDENNTGTSSTETNTVDTTNESKDADGCTDNIDSPTPAAELEPPVNDCSTENCSKSDVFSAEPITTDSGIEIDTK